MTRPTLLLAALMLGASMAVNAAPDNAGNEANAGRCFNGYAYTLDGGDYRYTEHHEQQRANGRITRWDVTYVGRNGATIATKHMNFSDNPTVPVYTMKIPADGYMEGIRHDDGHWTMVRRKSENAKTQTQAFEIDKPMAADSGFDPLIRTKFEQLTNGATSPFKFAAAGRQSVINLRARRAGETSFNGQPAVTFVAELDMFLINYFVDSLKLTYDVDSKRLLEYRGIGNMHNEAGDVYPVRVTYASEMPEVAKQAGAPAASCGSMDS